MARQISREDRFKVQVGVDLQNGAGKGRSVTVINLSRNGCRFVADGQLRFGSRIAIAAGRAGVLNARVMWRLGKTHGVRFDRPLPQPVFDHIRLFLSKQPALVAERQVPLAA